MKTILDTVEIYTNPHKKFDYTVIWMHGLGADGNDFVPVIDQLSKIKNKNVKFILPHAPIRPIRINNNMKMRGWYDIFSLERSLHQDNNGIIESKNLISQLIYNENTKHNIPFENISIAGFSQGGAMALISALTFPEKLNSILALSCYMPIHDTFMELRSKANNDISIFLAHGKLDPIIPISFSSESRDFLNNLNYNVFFHEYLMEHSVCQEEINDIDDFFNKNLS